MVAVVPPDPFDSAAELFAALYAQALAAGAEMTAPEVVALARRTAGRDAAPAAVAEAAQTGARINEAARALAADISTAAAAEAVSAIQDWANLERATEVLAASIAAVMSTPMMATADRRAVETRARDIAGAVSRSASESAADTALRSAIVSRATADAAADVASGAASDARDIVYEIARTAGRLRDTAALSAHVLRRPDGHPDDESYGDRA